ncbi:MAG: hypothetical protein K0S27_526 [Gammaproteobacteria bacterium]|jgi:hypothetical protein|nr:hypothetical protein [Gammaproteobacteria bacterium]
MPHHVHRSGALSAEKKSLKDALDKNRGKHVFSPLMMKKKDLMIKLDCLTDELDVQWELYELEDEASNDPLYARKRNLLKKTIAELKVVLDSVQTLSAESEESFLEDLNKLNKTLDEYNSLISTNTDLDIHERKITVLNYGINLSNYMSYVGAGLRLLVTIILACRITLIKAATLAGSIFSPVNAVLFTTTRLLGFLTRLVEFQKLTKITKKLRLAQEKELEKETKILLITSGALRVTSFVLNILVVVALFGALSNPVGWGLIAAATAVDWLDESVLEAKKAEGAYHRKEKEYEEKCKQSEEAEQAYEKLQEDYDNSSEADQRLMKMSLYNLEKEAQQIKSEQKYMKEELEALKEKAIETRSEERWGRVNTLAMILIACAPIPFVGQGLLAAGGILFGIAVARNIYVAAKPHLQKYFSSAKQQTSASEEIELSDLTLGQKKQYSSEHVIRRIQRTNLESSNEAQIELVQENKPFPEQPQPIAPSIKPNSSVFRSYSMPQPGDSKVPRKEKPTQKIDLAEKKIAKGRGKGTSKKTLSIFRNSPHKLLSLKPKTPRRTTPAMKKS